MKAAGYRGAVEMLSEASRGSYRGPAVSVGTLAEALDTTQGMDVGQLLEHTRLAAEPCTVDRDEVSEALWETLGGVAAGAVAGMVAGSVDAWVRGDEEAAQFICDVDEAGAVVRDIGEVADSAVTDILEALGAVISQLCVFLRHVDTAEHPEQFAECVAAGAELIDDAGGTIVDCCRDRDEAIGGCFDEVLDRGEGVGAVPETADGETGSSAPATSLPELAEVPEPPPPPKQHQAGGARTVGEW